jgi:DNA-directed RNA polymerase II subunit RPB1
MCHNRIGLYGIINKINENSYTFKVCDTVNKHNDIVLDKIVEINIIGIEKYPKVYDLTIPSTLNFGLANGLQVRDTSDTGYIQRKLIKGMEDARIMTDYTVRNANGTIIQFLYGEDGFDGVKIEKQKYTTLNMSDKEIHEKFMLRLEADYLRTMYVDNVVQDIMKHRELLQGKFETHINKIIKDRDYYYEHLFKGTVNEDLFAPINFRRLIGNASYQFGSKNGLSDLNPSYIFEKLDYLEDNLTITDSYKGNELIMVLAHIHLSPLSLLKEKINKLAFDYIIATINQQFYSSIAHPGELVGTISAQSMGEPSKICVLGTGRCHVGYLITYMGKHCKLGRSI